MSGCSVNSEEGVDLVGGTGDVDQMINAEEEGGCRRLNTNSHSAPLSYIASWQYSFIRMFFVEGGDKGRIQDEESWNPRAFLRIIALPVQEVLVATTPAANIQKAPDGEHRVDVNQIWGGGAMLKMGTIQWLMRSESCVHTLSKEEVDSRW